MSFFTVTNWLILMLPVAALLLMAATVTGMMWRERHSRRRRLQTPAEAAELDRLLQAGKISIGEAGQLKHNCNALPLPADPNTMPDLPLRLAAAFSRIYAVMLLAQLVLLGIYVWRHPNTLGAVGFDRLLEPAPLTILMLLAVISIAEYVAAGRMLQGSVAARYVVLFAWIAGLWWLQPAFFAIVWMPAVAIFVIWALCWRDGATTLSAKLLLALALLASGWGAWHWAPRQSTSSCVSGSSSGASLGLKTYLSKIHLAVTTPEPETHALACALQQQMQTAGFPTEVIPFGTPRFDLDAGRELLFAIGRGEWRPNATKSGFAQAFSDWVQRQLKPSFSDGDSSPFYQLICLNGDAVDGGYLNGLQLPGFGLSLNAWTEERSGSAEVVQRWWEQLREYLPKLRDAETIQLPAVPVPTTWPELKPEEKHLASFRLLGRIRHLEEAQEIYAFQKGELETDLKHLQELLAPLQLRISHESAGTYTFRGPVECREAVLHYRQVLGWIIPPDDGVLYTDTALLTVTRSIPKFASNVPRWLEEFAAGDLRGFMLSGGINRLKGDEYETQLRNFFALPQLSVESRYQALELLLQRYTPLTESERDLARREFGRLAAETTQLRELRSFIYQVESLFHITESVEKAALQAQLSAALGTDFREFVVPAVPGNDGYVRLHFRIAVPRITDSRNIVKLSFADTDYLPIFFPVGIQPIGNERYDTQFMGSGGADNLDRLSRLTVTSRWRMPENGNRWPQALSQTSTSSMAPTRNFTVNEAEKLPPPGELRLSLKLNLEANSYDFQVIFAPLSPPLRPLQSRLAELEEKLQQKPLSESSRTSFRQLADAAAAVADDPDSLRNLIQLATLAGLDQSGALKRELAEAFPGSYHPVMIPTTPDADGLARHRQRILIPQARHVQQLIELAYPGNAAKSILLPIQIRPAPLGDSYRCYWIEPDLQELVDDEVARLRTVAVYQARWRMPGLAFEEIYGSSRYDRFANLHHPQEHTRGLPVPDQYLLPGSGELAYVLAFNQEAQALDLELVHSPKE